MSTSKNQRNSFLLACCLLATLVGCSSEKKAKAFDIDRLKSEMQKEGWTYLETLGEPGESIAETRLDSATGLSLTAFWVSNGQRNQKVYEQTNALYAIISVQKSSGDTFAIVFQKPRIQ